MSMSIHYTLDGKTVTPSELAGKSGKVTIRFEYENNQYEVRTVNGVSQKVYVPSWPLPAPVGYLPLLQCHRLQR